jgi:hypothetical protein
MSLSPAPAEALGLPAVPDDVKETAGGASWKTARDQRAADEAQDRQAPFVIIDEPGGGPSRARQGRTKADAPQIDGVAFVASGARCARVTLSRRKSSARRHMTSMARRPKAAYVGAKQNIGRSP